MIFYLVFGQKYGVELSILHYDISYDQKVLFSFRIFAGSVTNPWFKWRVTANHQALRFELGHGKLQSAWEAQGPIRRVQQ